MITASPGVITAGAASGLLVARAARGLHTFGAGYALFAASAARGAVFLVNGVRPAPGRGSFRAAVPLAGPGGGITRFRRPGGGTVRLLPVLMSRCRCLARLPHGSDPAGA